MTSFRLRRCGTSATGAGSSPSLMLESCAARGHFLSWNRANGLMRLLLPPTATWERDCSGPLAWRLMRPGLVPEAFGSPSVSLVAATPGVELGRGSAAGKGAPPWLVSRHAGGVLQVICRAAARQHTFARRGRHTLVRRRLSMGLLVCVMHRWRLCGRARRSIDYSPPMPRGCLSRGPPVVACPPRRPRSLSASISQPTRCASV